MLFVIIERRNRRTFLGFQKLLDDDAALEAKLGRQGAPVIPVDTCIERRRGSADGNDIRPRFHERLPAVSHGLDLGPGKRGSIPNLAAEWSGVLAWHRRAPLSSHGISAIVRLTARLKRAVSKMGGENR